MKDGSDQDAVFDSIMSKIAAQAEKDRDKVTLFESQQSLEAKKVEDVFDVKGSACSEA